MRYQPTPTHKRHEIAASGERPAFGQPDPLLIRLATLGRLDDLDRYLAARAELAAYFAGRGVR